MYKQAPLKEALPVVIVRQMLCAPFFFFGDRRPFFFLPTAISSRPFCLIIVKRSKHRSHPNTDAYTNNPHPTDFRDRSCCSMSCVLLIPWNN